MASVSGGKNISVSRKNKSLDAALLKWFNAVRISDKKWTEIFCH